MQGTESTLFDLLSSSCEKHAKKNAFGSLGSKLTYAQFFEYSKSLANYLKFDLKIKPGDTVAIMMPNLLQYPVAIFGIILAGGVVVNLNPLDKAPALKRELKKSEARVIIVLEHFISELNIIIDDVDLEHMIFTSVGALYNPIKGFIYNFIIRYIKRQVPAWKFGSKARKYKITRFQQALKRGCKHKFIDPKIKPDDLAFLQFTGGTTGDPKAVMLTHANIMVNLEQCYEWVSEVFTHEQEIVVTPLPLYHIFALVANLLLFIKVGGLNILIPNARDLDAFIKQIENIKFNVISGVNTLYLGLLNHPKFKKCNFSKLSLAIAGGMRLDKDIAIRFHDLTKVPLTQGYGLTETSPVIAICPVNTKYNGAAGKALKYTKICIMDQSDKALPVGSKNKGEILVKGPQVMKGYWKNPKATKSVINSAGWLKTGDYGYLDKSGYLFIVDRIKDIINVSGFNVCASEVEEIILGLDEVQQVAVVGKKDDKHGEIIIAHVVFNKGKSLSEKEIIKHAHAKLAAYKSPKKVVVHKSLAKNTVGKILKHKL